MCSSFPRSFFYKIESELMQIPSKSSVLVFWARLWQKVFLLIGFSSSSMKIFSTVIRFRVSVPVLSVQILFAPPIVSQSAICLTKLLSLLILPKEKASAIVTAKGRPSGTAITTIVMPIIKKLTKCPSVSKLKNWIFP